MSLLWKDKEADVWVRLDLKSATFEARPVSHHGDNDDAPWTNIGRQLDPFEIEEVLARKMVEMARLPSAAVAVPETREATEQEISAGEPFDDWWNSLTPQAVAWPPRALAAAAHGSGAAAERERLLPLLRRCLNALDTVAALGTVKGDDLYKTLRADLRRELGLLPLDPHDRGPIDESGSVYCEGGPLSAQADRPAGEGDDDGEHAQQADAGSVPAVHPCCGCSCHVCASGHAAGQHTAECWNRLREESGLE